MSWRKRAKLPIAGDATRIRPSKNSRRRAAVLIGVHVVVAAHIVHWRLTGSTLSPLEPSEAMELAKHDVVNAGLLFFAAAIVATAVAGRFFCGWGCHLVALQDFARWLLARAGIRPRPLRSRLLAFVPLIAFFYMFLWPAVYRLWHGLEFHRPRAELTTSAFWATFPGWPVAVATFLVCGFVVICFLGAKGFCTYACPYGAILGVADRLAPLRIRVTDACAGCGHCTAVCTSNVRVHEEVRTYGMVVDPGCMKCMDCVGVCPNEALYVGLGAPALGARPRPGKERPSHRPGYSWPEELALAVFFAAGFFTFRGLYGMVPFLFSLGLAAILAYLAVQLLRLAYRPNLRIRKWALKRAGVLTTTGHAFAASMVVFGAFWVHSALVQYHAFRAARLTVAADPSAENLEAAYGHLSWVHRRGLRRDSQVTVRLAGLAARTGRDETAAALYTQAISERPHLVSAYLGLGLLRAEQGHMDAAEKIFARGVAARPSNVELHYNLGLVQAMRGDAESAMSRFREALEIAPRYLEARENLAGLLCGVGRYEEGIEQFERALEIAPDAATHVLVARAHLALRDRENAEIQLRQALEIDADHAEASRMLADLTKSRAGGTRIPELPNTD